MDQQDKYLETLRNLKPNEYVEVGEQDGLIMVDYTREEVDFPPGFPKGEG